MKHRHFEANRTQPGKRYVANARQVHLHPPFLQEADQMIEDPWVPGVVTEMKLNDTQSESLYEP